MVSTKSTHLLPDNSLEAFNGFYCTWKPVKFRWKHFKPIAKRRPDICIVHTCTNDLKDSDELSIGENIVKVKETIENISPGTKTLISTLVNRYDSEELHLKTLRVNEKLKQLSPAYDLIDNGNLGQGFI